MGCFDALKALILLDFLCSKASGSVTVFPLARGALASLDDLRAARAIFLVVAHDCEGLLTFLTQFHTRRRIDLVFGLIVP